jgi:lysophospholipase L1-like esterase
MKEHIRRGSRLAAILLANVALLAALLVMIEGLSSYAFFLKDLVPRLRESGLRHTTYDAEIGWVGLPNVDIKDMYGPGAHLRTNGRGFRNAKDFPPKRDSDTRRIVCSGDSVTFGEYVGNDQTFCSVLAELDPKLESINMGQLGYGVDQAYLWYRRDADDLEVDVHFFAFITHDFMRMQYDRFMGIPRPVVVLEDGKPVVTNVPISQATYAMPTWLAETLNSADGLRTLKLATGIRKRLNLAPRKVPGAWDARGADEVKAVVAGLFEALRDYDAARSRATVLVYFPSVEELQQPNAELAYWISVVESNARRLDIPFVNFVSLFAELPAADVVRLFVDGYHFSEEGHALVARELLEHLRGDTRIAARLQ